MSNRDGKEDMMNLQKRCCFILWSPYNPRWSLKVGNTTFSGDQTNLDVLITKLRSNFVNPSFGNYTRVMGFFDFPYVLLPSDKGHFVVYYGRDLGHTGGAKITWEGFFTTYVINFMDVVLSQ